MIQLFTGGRSVVLLTDRPASMRVIVKMIEGYCLERVGKISQSEMDKYKEIIAEIEQTILSISNKELGDGGK